MSKRLSQAAAMLILLASLVGCRQDDGVRDLNRVSQGVWRYEDSDAICYTYYDRGISCLPKVKQ